VFHKSNPAKWPKLIYEATIPSDRLHATLLAERLQWNFSWNEVVPTRVRDVGEIGHLKGGQSNQKCQRFKWDLSVLSENSNVKNMHQLSMVSSVLALRNLNLVKTHFNLTKYKHALICPVPKVNSRTMQKTISDKF
jgi:hypothetical protein